MIDGDVTLNDLELDGSLRLSADGELPNKVVKMPGFKQSDDNAGCWKVDG